MECDHQVPSSKYADANDHSAFLRVKSMVRIDYNKSFDRRALQGIASTTYQSLVLTTTNRLLDLIPGAARRGHANAVRALIMNHSRAPKAKDGKQFKFFIHLIKGKGMIDSLLSRKFTILTDAPRARP